MSHSNIRQPLPPCGEIRYQSATRGYSISWQSDLLGQIVVRRRWYGLNSRRGGGKEHVASSLAHAAELIASLHERRSKRGYGVVSGGVTHGASASGMQQWLASRAASRVSRLGAEDVPGSALVGGDAARIRPTMM